MDSSTMVVEAMVVVGEIDIGVVVVTAAVSAGTTVVPSAAVTVKKISPSIRWPSSAVTA